MARIRHRFIRSRGDFFAVLAECLRLGRDFERGAPGDPFFVSVRRQLEAMEPWTANGRKPTKDERRSVDFGTRVVRDLEPPPTPELGAWGERLKELFSYFKHWKSDPDWNALDDDDFRTSDPDEFAP